MMETESKQLISCGVPGKERGSDGGKDDRKKFPGMNTFLFCTECPAPTLSAALMRK